MYAIIRDGGRQVRVEKGAEVEVDRKALKEGEKVEFGEVLVLHDGKDLQVGTPTVAGAKVLGEVLGESSDRKIRVHKYIRREDSHHSRGHRQKHTVVRITDIVAK